MRYVWTMGILAGIGTAAVAGAEKPPADYVALMKSAGASAGAVRQALEAGDFARVGTAATELKTVLEKTEAFWAARRSDDAVAMARNGQKAADDLIAAAAEKNSAGASTASQALTASCGGCHNAHRERLADGTFEIK